MRVLANAYYGYVMVTVIRNSMLSEWVIIGSVLLKTLSKLNIIILYMKYRTCSVLFTIPLELCRRTGTFFNSYLGLCAGVVHFSSIMPICFL